MYYCLFGVAHQSYVEYMFGQSPGHREPSGALDHAHLPRDPVSACGVALVVGLFAAWFLVVLAGIGPVVPVFLCVLLVHAFALPMAVMYLPALALDQVGVSWGR